MSANSSDETQIRALVQQFENAFSGGESARADQLLTRVESLAPRHPLVLNAVGQRYIHRGDPRSAREVLQAAVDIDRSNPAFWVNLATAQRQLGLADDAMSSLDQALAAEPRFLPALLQ